LGHIGLREAHIPQAGLGHAGLGSGNRTWVPLDPHHFSRRTNEKGCYQSYVSNAGAQIQDTLTWTDACLPEESLGVRGEPRSLPD